MATSLNLTGNFSLAPPLRDQSIDEFVEVIVTPLVCLVGTVLNLLAVGAFMSRSLRSISCCLYLATRSIAVFGFLLSMGVAWSNTFSSLYRTEVICELTTFLSYFCPFLSVWMVVAISAENFIRIAQPSKVKTYCTARVAKMVIGSVCLVGALVLNFPLWTFRVQNGQCNSLTHFMPTVMILNYVDTALTLLAPFVLMIILVPLVALAALHSFERKKRLSIGNPRSSIQDTSSRSPEAKVTHLLLAVSVVFLLLHTPFHAIRIKLFILALTGNVEQTTSVDPILLRVFRMVYNMDTCASCAVYLLFGDNFRRVFCDLYFSGCRKKCKSRSRAHARKTQLTSTTSECVTSMANQECRSATNNTVDNDHHNNGGCGDDDDDDENDDRMDEESKTRQGLLEAVPNHSAANGGDSQC